MSKEITCNICGRPFDLWDTQENYSIYTTCGYGSKFDGETIEMDICCGCFDKLVEGCKISPILKDEREWHSELRGLRFGFRAAESDVDAVKAIQDIFKKGDQE